MSFFRALAVSFALALPLTTTPFAALADGMKMADPIHLGPLVLSGGFSRATLPNAPVAGGFLTIQNTGTTDDTLIGAASAVAGHAAVHEMKMVGDVMKMQELKDGLPIPAGQTVTLKPGGYHIMFLDLKQPLVEGKTVMVTLTFKKAGSVEVPLTIGAPNAGAKGMDMKQQGMLVPGSSAATILPAAYLPGLSGTAEAPAL